MQQGYTISYAADAEIVHVHDETPKRIYNRYRREAIALKRIFPHEQFRLRDFAQLCVANVLTDYVHAWRDRVLRRNLRSIFVFRLMQFWGTYRGFAQQGSLTSQLKQTFYYPGVQKRTSSAEWNTREQHRIDYSSMPVDMPVNEKY
jgi:hypothetical protein